MLHVDSLLQRNNDIKCLPVQQQGTRQPSSKQVQEVYCVSRLSYMCHQSCSAALRPQAQPTRRTHRDAATSKQP